MQFLETIEGKSGEELTSAVLKFLLINSSTMRDCFAERLRQMLPASRTPKFRDGIICQSEVGVVDNDDTGRIDLLIREELGMVIGLENKFWAQFTGNQPSKYWKGLPEYAHDKSEAACRIVLLVPKAREDEMKIHIANQQLLDKCILLFWDDLREDFSRVMGNERREVAAVAYFLDEYVKKQIIEIKINLRRQLVVGTNVQIGNDFHYEFLSKLKSCLPNVGKISPAKNWIGVHFTVDRKPGATEIKQWVGFLSTDELSRNVVFGLHTGIPVFNLPQLSFARLIKGFGNAAFVEIDFDESVETTIAWGHRLEQLLTPLKDAVSAYSAALPPNTEMPEE